MKQETIHKYRLLKVCNKMNYSLFEILLEKKQKTSEVNQNSFCHKSFLYPSIRNFLTPFLKAGSDLHCLIASGNWFQKFIALTESECWVSVKRAKEGFRSDLFLVSWK